MIQERHRWILEELRQMKKNGQISKPRKRGGKGYANFPIKWSIEGNFKDYGVKENGVLYRVFLSYSSEIIGGIVFIDLDLRKKAKDNQLKRIFHDSGYVTWRKKMTDDYGKMLLEFSRNEISEKNIESASNEKLMEIYNKFREIYTKYEFYNGIWFIVSDDLWKEVVERLERLGCKNLEELEILSSCPFQSFINKEKIDVLKTAIGIFKDKKLRSFVEKNDFENFILNYSILKDLVGSYSWIPFGHVGPELFDEQHYFQEIRKLIGQDLAQELEKAENFYPNIQKKQAELLTRYNVDKDTRRILNDVYLLIIMQDDRKELIARTHVPYINNLMKKIGSYFDLKPQEAADLYPDIVEKGLLKGIFDLDLYHKDVKSDKKIELTETDGYTTYFDEDADEFLNIILDKSSTGEISGMAASLGYAKGRAKVLKNADEGHKLEKGDILVTTMTTPDFLPYMSKASAIITDEGGITCHAAIVSREFGIPCIVGTNNATEILKDGDLVEVDAAEGKVKKLE
jgi:phosphohistidine swiveling domain-containing protein